MTILILTPSEATNLKDDSVSLTTFNLSKEEENYATGKSKKQMALIRTKLKSGSFKLKLNGIITTNGIVVSDTYNTHSIGVSLSNHSDTDAFSKLFDIFSNLSLDEYDQRPLIKEDVLWLKLKRNNTSYLFKSNSKKLNPKKPSETELVNDQNVEIICDVKGYINFEDKFYGLTLQINELNIV